MTTLPATPRRADLVEITDEGQMRLNLHPGQVLAMESQATETYITAGVQSGKTSGLPHWLRREMVRCGPGNRGLVYLAIGPTYSVLENKLMPEMQRIFCDITGWGRFYKAPKPRIEISPAGEVALWGHRQTEPTNIYFAYAADPNSFAGFTALAAVGDEIGQPQFKRGAYVELKGRLSIARGQVAPGNAKVGMPADLKMGRFLGGSIVYGLNWLYDLYKIWVEAARQAKDEPGGLEKLRRGTAHPLFHFIRFDSTLNPAFPKEEFDHARATMDEWYFNMRYRGIFSKPESLIYKAWKSAYELDAPEVDPIPGNWPRAGAVDPGDVNFWGMFCHQNPSSGVWTAHRIYHDAENSFQQRAQIIKELEPNLEWCIAGQISEDRWRRELHLGGLTCQPPPFKDYWAGINTGIAAIRGGLFKVLKEECGELIDEFQTLQRPVNDQGEVQLGVMPVAHTTMHLADCFRYFCAKAFTGLASTPTIASGRREEARGASVRSGKIRVGAVAHGSFNDTLVRPQSGLRPLDGMEF